MQRGNWKKYNTLILYVILHNHRICDWWYSQDKPFICHHDKTNSNPRSLLLTKAFSDFFSRRCSLLEFQHRRGLVLTALCVSQSRCTTLPFRFMQIAELGEMHTSVRVGDSRSFVSVKSTRVLQAWRFRRTPEDWMSHEFSVSLTLIAAGIIFDDGINNRPAQQLFAAV